MRDVFDVQSPDEVTYAAFDDSGRDILLPTLGLERRPSSSEPSNDLAPLRPRSDSELRGAVLATLRELTGDHEFEPDDDGDLWLTRGDVTLLIRVDRKAPIVDILSTVLYGVEPSLDVHEALRGINDRLCFASLRIRESRIVGRISVDAAVFVPELFVHALQALADAVEAARRELRDRLAGKTLLGGETAGGPTPGHQPMN